MIRFQGVEKSFKQKKVLRNLSFQIEKGEIVALLGPNGVGKSTAIQLLLGLQKPDFGKISVFGKQVGSLDARKRVGVMLQGTSLLKLVTVRELLLLVKAYYSNSMSVKELLKLVGIDSKILSLRTEELSGGQKRLVHFALALVGNPKVLVLDEPTVGMDVQTRRHFWKTVAFLAEQGKTILFTTHYIEEAEQVATRILVLREGVILHDESPGLLKKQLCLHRVSFHRSELFNASMLQQFPDVDIRSDGNNVTLLTKDADSLLNRLHTLDPEFKDLVVHRGTLEDVYTSFFTQREEKAK